MGKINCSLKAPKIPANQPNEKSLSTLKYRLRSFPGDWYDYITCVFPSAAVFESLSDAPFNLTKN